MKVAFVHPRAPGAEGTGAAHSATRIVDVLEEAGCSVTSYCLARPDPAAARRYRCEPLDVDGFPYHSAMRLNAGLRARAAELDRMDLIHSYLPRSLPAMNHLSRRTSASTVVTLNAYGGVCPKNDLRYLDREPCRRNGPLRCLACSVATSGGHGDRGPVFRSLSRLGNLYLVQRAPPEALAVDGLQVLSAHSKAIYTEFGYPADRMRVIPNILDERFLVEPPDGEPEEPFGLLYVGSLDEHKGVLLLPELLERLNERGGPTFRMTIVGDGGARERLEEEAARRRVAARIDLRGPLPHEELPPVYASHDLFVYPGQWDEPFGRVLIESLAAGTPVVGTDVGAVREIVGDAGVVVEPTGAALAEAVARVVTDGSLEARASAARAEASRYASDVVGPELLSLYRDVLDRRS